MLTEKVAKLPKLNPSGSKLVAKPKHFPFTRERIEALPWPEKGQPAYYYDDKIRGLAVSVSPQGKKVFVLYRKIAGRPERYVIGPFRDLSIEQARHRAEELNGDIATGKNPASRRRQVRDEMTLGELFQHYLDNYAKEHKRTWTDDVGTFNLHLRSWHLRKISSIRKLDVIALHAKIGRTRGKYAANRTIELLCSLFNRARNDWGWEGENPASAIKAFKERKRERFLQGDELPAFFQSLAQELNTTIRDYILVSLLTGARRSNVQGMRWDEVIWDRATWIIPAEKSKIDEPIHVALTPVVVRILNDRKANASGEWVFPGRGRSGHLEEPKTAWKRILKRAATIQREEWLKLNPGQTEADFRKEFPTAGLPDVRLHDLRRTLGSWQAAAGSSLAVIGKSLGHSSLQATQVYARLHLDPVRESVTKATNAMLVAGGVAGLLGEGK